MVDTASLFSTLEQAASPEIARTLRRLVDSAPDAGLNRINPLRFAAEHGFGERESIAAFLHGTRLGLFELGWNLLCRSCAGTLHAGASLREIDQAHYTCTFCALDTEPTLDESIEVTFTVSPRVRRIAAHDPDSLPLWDYARQIYWSSAMDLPEGLASLMGDTILDAVELPALNSARRRVSLSPGTVIIFDPVSHAGQFIEVDGKPAGEPQQLAVGLNDAHVQRKPITLNQGPLDLVLENSTPHRTLPIVWAAGDRLMELMGRRLPFLTAKRLLTHQTFRDIYRTDVLDIDQRFKITSLTFLFTDLKSSTELYERIGDLAAYDLVRAHFRALTGIVTEEGGAIVKTIGDAVMATFPTPRHGLTAALRMRAAIDDMNRRSNRDDLRLKIGLHEGPCLAVTLNERQDYFGQTVNIAARLQSLAQSRTILTTDAVIGDAEVAALLGEKALRPNAGRAALRGIQEEMAVYEIA
jgi:class 3 adenylate cyclase